MWKENTEKAYHIVSQGRSMGMDDRNKSESLTPDVLYHTMPHTPCKFEVKDVYSLQHFGIYTF